MHRGGFKRTAWKLIASFQPPRIIFLNVDYVLNEFEKKEELNKNMHQVSSISGYFYSMKYIKN
ncbi:hypothetical protein BpHYR1_030361 [Brachionus plicatilis]|uniref:Uncharacterized protein n=1 Tax=Brachionus plicatilis TaxID=10195 RepID=A0A3M7RBR0_BRAPC|nr:hypothetical protein BpHYR1_030361 [Brachionus plicatilis]